VVEKAQRTSVQIVGEGKRRVSGQTQAGRWLQVIYVLKEPSEVGFAAVSPLDWSVLEDMPFAKITRVIHAMEMTSSMKRRMRRRKK
jgi:hypothetical protein